MLAKCEKEGIGSDEEDMLEFIGSNEDMSMNPSTITSPTENRNDINININGNANSNNNGHPISPNIESELEYLIYLEAQKHGIENFDSVKKGLLFINLFFLFCFHRIHQKVKDSY
jgi:hypothetical protein